MFVYRKPDVKLSQMLLGSRDGTYNPWLKQKLELVRTEKIRVVYGLLFIGVAIMLINVLVLAALAIARSLAVT